MNAITERPALNVYQRINAARNAFHALKLKKTGHNKFAGYNYFELGDFLIPALKVFSDFGLFAAVSFDADKASMTIRNVDAPAEFVTIYSPMGSAALKGCHEVQNIGAVETYQRRYLWVAALEIVEHDALDSSKPIETAQAPAKAPNKHAPVNAAMEGVEIPENIMEELRFLAAELVDLVETKDKPAAARDLLDSTRLTEDELPVSGDYLLALSQILHPNSKTRAALKREGELRRKNQSLAGVM